MKLSSATGLLGDLWSAVQIALLPTLRAVFHSPRLLLSPHALSDIFMAHVWSLFGNGIDENHRTLKAELITPHATGIVLDIGAGESCFAYRTGSDESRASVCMHERKVDQQLCLPGYGHLAAYLDRNRVTKYVALEPNALMHVEIRKRALDAGFDEAAGTLQILPYGAEDMPRIVAALAPARADTIVSIMTFCSIPRHLAKSVLHNLVHDVLRSDGGKLLFFEHVRSPRKDVAWWQWMWSPIWSLALGGCRLDTPTHEWVQDMGSVWRADESHVWGIENEPEEHLFWHRIGRFVKA